MRLPAITQKQIQCENSRQFHERLYEHYLRGEALVITTPNAKQLQYQLSGSLKGFWFDRHFHFKTKTVTGGLSIRLEPFKTSGGTDAVAADVQPNAV